MNSMIHNIYFPLVLNIETFFEFIPRLSATSMTLTEAPVELFYVMMTCSNGLYISNRESRGFGCQQ